MNKTILLADDSLTIQKVVQLTFMEEDYEVVTVSSGDEALGKLNELEPDLVIADVHMPGASGYEICTAVKERNALTPVLLLVGTFEPFEASEAEGCGAEAHLKKPFDSQELLRLVERLLAGVGIEDEGEDEGMVQEAAETDDGAGEALGLGGQEEQPQAEALQEPAAEGEALGMSEEGPSEYQVGAEFVSEASPAMPVDLTDEHIDRIARRVVELMGDNVVREISWDVVPDLAEIVIKTRLKELESEVE
jgi:CheY-like chemotaxis protein